MHNLQYGFEPSYNVWIHHDEHLPMFWDKSNDEDAGSKSGLHDALEEMLEDVFRGDDMHHWQEVDNAARDSPSGCK